MTVIEDEIRDAIEKELTSANERFPLFHSMHEAYAVIAEEIDEAADELESIKANQAMAWSAVKANRNNAMQSLARLKFAAERLAIEACQVAAMCEKAHQSAENWR